VRIVGRFTLIRLDRQLKVSRQELDSLEFEDRCENVQQAERSQQWERARANHGGRSRCGEDLS